MKTKQELAKEREAKKRITKGETPDHPASSYAVLDDDTVINMVMWNGIEKWVKNVDVLVLIPSGEVCGIGYKYKNGKFEEPKDNNGNGNKQG